MGATARTCPVSDRENPPASLALLAWRADPPKVPFCGGGTDFTTPSGGALSSKWNNCMSYLCDQHTIVLTRIFHLDKSTVCFDLDTSIAFVV